MLSEIEVSMIFWKSCIESIPPPSTSNGTPNEMITADHIFIKIIPEMYLGIRMSPLQFGSYPCSADLQAPAVVHLTRR